MACLCPCVSDDEVEGDKYGQNIPQFQVSLQDAPCKDPGCCFVACVFCPCAVYHIRVKALENDMQLYRFPHIARMMASITMFHNDETLPSCCQGYMGKCSNVCNGQEKDCPECSLCLEAVCCIGCSISATR